MSLAHHYFEVSGALITVDGTGDEKIKFEGYPADLPPWEELMKTHPEDAADVDLFGLG